MLPRELSRGYGAPAHTSGAPLPEGPRTYAARAAPRTDARTPRSPGALSVRSGTRRGS